MPAMWELPETGDTGWGSSTAARSGCRDAKNKLLWDLRVLEALLAMILC